jgi:gamma-glutamylcysteine synthetase
MNDTEPLPKDIDALCEVFRGAEKPRAAFRIGLEAEKFGLTRDGRSLGYDGAEGVEGLFQALSARGFEARYDQHEDVHH